MCQPSQMPAVSHHPHFIVRWPHPPFPAGLFAALRSDFFFFVAKEGQAGEGRVGVLAQPPSPPTPDPKKRTWLKCFMPPGSRRGGGAKSQGLIRPLLNEPLT